jgi:hypothetical protein
MNLPTECQASFSYNLTLQSLGTKPTPFLTFDELLGIKIATSDISFAGSYLFNIFATDTIFGIKSEDMLFKVILICMPISI